MSLFSKELKKYLKDNKISVMKFSGLLKVHISTVYRWLDGTQKITKRNAKKIERVSKKFFTVEKICASQNIELNELV